MNIRNECLSITNKLISSFELCELKSYYMLSMIPSDAAQSSFFVCRELLVEALPLGDVLDMVPVFTRIYASIQRRTSFLVNVRRCFRHGSDIHANLCKYTKTYLVSC